VFSNQTLLNIFNFFTEALANQDTTVVSKAQTNLFTGMGASSSVTTQLLSTLSSLVTSCSSNPDASGETLIRQGVTEVLNLLDAFIASFPGMTNFETNSNISLNPSNADFFSTYHQVQDDLQDIITTPSYGLTYFSNDTAKYLIAQLGVLSAKTSQQPQNCKFNVFVTTLLLNTISFSIFSLQRQ
jgi:galactokinase/mevalonate kinase-like predicted kinase